ncbi:hypothetical protein [uncultured Pedobacter sp.]|uniref:hypothetical protein n=1 Tax=uncultured Pedobacter sp. TaxID=246139 RepID=UPI0025F8F933|nr:hypothetical protein [uncultured Pedobacter sp.]
MSYEQEAISINKIDKGCLIFNINKTDGYKVLVLDQSKSSNESAVYWKDEFLKKYSKKYSQEISEIERNLMSLSSKKSNLEKCVDLALEYAVDLPLKWVSADYHTKQQMQILLFPQGISYSKKTDESRTTMINSVFLYIAYF